MWKKDKTVLLVFGEGGHAVQSLRLLNLIKEQDNTLFFQAFTSKSSHGKTNFIAVKYLCEVPKNSGLIVKLYICLINLFTNLANLGPLIKSRKILIFGPGIAIPTIIICGLFFRKKTFVFESWSRFSTRSSTTRLASLLNLNIIYQNTLLDKNKTYGRL